MTIESYMRMCELFKAMGITAVAYPDSCRNVINKVGFSFDIPLSDSSKLSDIVPQLDVQQEKGVSI